MGEVVKLNRNMQPRSDTPEGRKKAEMLGKLIATNRKEAAQAEKKLDKLFASGEIGITTYAAALGLTHPGAYRRVKRLAGGE